MCSRGVEEKIKYARAGLLWTFHSKLKTFQIQIYLSFYILDTWVAE